MTATVTTSSSPTSPSRATSGCRHSLFVGGAAVVVTLAVCLVTWPLMDAATRHDNVRYE